MGVYRQQEAGQGETIWSCIAVSGGYFFVLVKPFVVEPSDWFGGRAFAVCYWLEQARVYQ
eukprot:2456915-Amphidinium_carterae.1